MAGKLTKTKLKAKLDKVFSIYVRTKDADEKGMVACFTCGQVKHWKEMHAGHFMSRARHATRWLTTNVKPQCPKCNLYNNGQQYQFGINLDAKYGTGTADRIRIASHETVKYTEADYEILIEQYTQATKV